MNQAKPTTDETDVPQLLWLLCGLVGAIFDRAKGNGRYFLAFWAVDPEGEKDSPHELFADWSATLKRLQADRAYFLEVLLNSIHRLTGVRIAPSSLHHFPEKTPAEIAQMLGDTMTALMLREDSPGEMWSALLEFYCALENEAQSPDTNEAKALFLTPRLLVNLLEAK